MSSTKLYRLSGGTLITGSILILINTLLNAVLYPNHNATPQVALSASWQLVTLTVIIGALLFVMGLPGMYLRQAVRAGIIGLVGFILLFLGILLQGSMFSMLQIILFPLLAQKAPQFLNGNNMPFSAFLLLLVSGLMYIVGAILLGIATMRTHVFPRWTGILMIVSGIALLLTLPPLPDALSTVIEVIGFIALSVAFVWCGYTLIAQKREAVETSPFTSTEVQTSR